MEPVAIVSSENISGDISSSRLCETQTGLKRRHALSIFETVEYTVYEEGTRKVVKTYEVPRTTDTFDSLVGFAAITFWLVTGGIALHFLFSL